MTTLGPAHPAAGPLAARPRLPSAHAVLTAILCLGTLIAWWTPPADVALVTWRVCVLLSALFGALAARVSRDLGYGPGTAGARGVGLAAFLGAGLLCRSFLSGASLNLIAWGLLPPDAQLTWTAWAVAALPTTAIVFAGGALAILFSARTSPVRAEGTIHAPEQRTDVARGEWITGTVLAMTMLGFVVAPRFEVHMAWVVWAGVTVLCMTGTLSRERLRSGVDWPLVIFLGVILSLAGVVTHAGLDGHVVALAQRVFPGSYGSTAVNVTVLYAVVASPRLARAMRVS